MIHQFRECLQSKGLIDQSARIWNADDTGFNIGGNKNKVIGPTRRDLNVCHIVSVESRSIDAIIFSTCVP